MASTVLLQSRRQDILAWPRGTQIQEQWQCIPSNGIQQKSHHRHVRRSCSQTDYGHVKEWSRFRTLPTNDYPVSTVFHRDACCPSAVVGGAFCHRSYASLPSGRSWLYVIASLRVWRMFLRGRQRRRRRRARRLSCQSHIHSCWRRFLPI